MDAKKAADLISENLTGIYGYAFAKLYAKEDADDLTSEIVCAILSSAENLQNEKAFWGFAWKVAENTFRKFIRKRDIRMSHECGLEEDMPSAVLSSPEDDFIDRESNAQALSRLRRELALLTKTNREVTVAYYLYGKSCSEIAKAQKISIDMVKYHLFKTRKLLKEGIGMTRTFGEKSYNPGIFRMDFWGDWNYYNDLFKRKLPGSIVLAAYDMAMTEEELVMELGVAAPYIEDELDILVKAGILLKEGSKYRTNIVIVTDAYEKEFVKKTASYYAAFAEESFAFMKEKLSEIRALPFHGNDYEDNRLLWNLLTNALWQGYVRSDKRSPVGKPPALPLGGNGFVFGYDNNYENHHYQGITGRSGEEDAWFTAINFRVALSAQHWKHRDFVRKVDVTVDAIKGKEAKRDDVIVSELINGGIVSLENEHLSARFPVFTEDSYEKFLQTVEPLIEKTSNLMIEISDIAEKMLAEHSPVSVRAQCGDIAKHHHRIDVMAFAMEHLVEAGALIIPTEKAPVGILGVKKA